MIDDLKKIAKFVLIAFVVLLVLGVIIGTISYLTSPPSFASSDDSVEIDIGQDGYLKASIKKSLQYKSENIPDGEVNASGDLIKWKDARNISYVNYLGKKAYRILVLMWLTPQKLPMTMETYMEKIGCMPYTIRNTIRKTKWCME